MTLAPGGLEALVYRVWDGRTAGDRALRAALAPAAVVYGAVVTLRNRMYDAGWLRAARVPARVLSVGNLVVGGSGKTPATLWLAARLAARGRRTGIVARGYGKRHRGVVVVGERGQALVAPAEGGDEAVMLAHRFAGPVVTGEHRVAAARLACTRFGLDTIVVDDGFQHRALARDADLVLVPGDMMTSRVLPAGPLREPTTALGRARGILVVDGAATPVTAGVPTFRATLRPSAAVRAAGGVWSTEPLDVVQGERLLAVAGIARPARFVEMLSRLGTGPVETLVFPDHHRYTAGDAARIAAAAGGRLLVTTEKDLVKLAAFPVLQRLRAIRVDLEVEDGDRLLDLLGE